MTDTPYMPVTRGDDKAAEHRSQKRSFASYKFDLMKALVADPRLHARAKVIAICIISHINQHTRETMLSDQAISDETAIELGWIGRNRKALRACGWIGWKRTGGANIYWALDGMVHEMAARLAMLKLKRDQRRETEHRDWPPAADHDPTGDQPLATERKIDQPSETSQNAARDGPQASRDRSQTADYDPPQAADIHLPSYTYSTPKGPLTQNSTIEESKSSANAAATRHSVSLENKQKPTNIDEWISATTEDERHAIMSRIVADEGLGRNGDLLEAEIKNFLDFYQSHSKELRTDWPAEWRDWVRVIIEVFGKARWETTP
jgi:hypothetical protein